MNIEIRLFEYIHICIPSKNQYSPYSEKEINYADKSKCRKKLEFSDCNMPTSFSLINLHKHSFGCHPNKSHGLALMRIKAVLGNDWLEWAQQNCEKCEVM
jgi:hypothetical protein